MGYQQLGTPSSCSLNSAYNCTHAIDDCRTYVLGGDAHQFLFALVMRITFFKRKRFFTEPYPKSLLTFVALVYGEHHRSWRLKKKIETRRLPEQKYMFSFLIVARFHLSMSLYCGALKISLG